MNYVPKRLDEQCLPVLLLVPLKGLKVGFQKVRHREGHALTMEHAIDPPPGRIFALC